METVALKPWLVPNYAQFDMPPGKRQDGIKELPPIAVADLSAEALSGLAEAWLTELYAKAGKPHNWSFATPPSSPVMGVGEGFVVVPVEPTDAMIEAGKDSLFEHARFVAIDRDPLFCWRAMVHAAAPPATQPQGADNGK